MNDRSGMAHKGGSRWARALAAAAAALLAACGGGNAPVSSLERSARAAVAQSQASTVAPTVTAGSEHACALTAAAGVQCWGNNSFGQLGNGSTAPTSGPVAVVGMAASVRAVSAGGSRTCALTSTGGVKCWGLGYLGDGSFSSTTPVDVTGLTQGVQSISIGTTHSCAVTGAGGVKCWGSNDNGQVGVSGDTVQPLPVDVQGLASGVRKVSAGQSHTCALMESGAVKCWGSNLQGQHGSGSLIGISTTPVDVVNLGEPAIDIDGTHGHVCAAMASGAVMCWGDNGTWQLGSSGASQSRTPLAVSGVAGVVSVHTGSAHTCARAGTGAVRCWGNGSLGQLGDPNALSDWYVRVDPVGLGTRVSALAAGPFFNCAMLQADVGLHYVRCWGANESGQVGVPRRDEVLEPVLQPSLYQVTSIDAGGSHTCAVLQSGGAQCWGSNASGQLGDGTVTDRVAPTDVQGLAAAVRSISAGRGHTCALNVTGGLHCWGSNGFGQLGDGTTQNRWLPVEVVGFAGSSLGIGDAVSAGYVHTCGITASGSVQCWGYNLPWSLGDGTSIDRPTPANVFGLDNGVANIGAEGTRGCAVMWNGEVKCWGWEYGSSVPVSVGGFAEPVRALSVGERHECALTSFGRVQCWGAGILGDGNPGTPSYRVQEPVQVAGLEAGALSVAVGADHACAVTAAGGVVCWGANTSGALGDGTKVDRMTPVAVSGIASGAVAVTTGAGHSCALMNDGGVRCWGRNDAGQVGVDPNVHVRTPIDVQGLDLGDTLPPVASPTRSGTTGAAGWSRTDVTVNWNWSDWGLGIDAAHCTSTSVSSGEGSAIILSATCADLVGNTGAASLSVKVDKTAPVASITSGPSGTVSATSATFAFVATDALSGVASLECSLDGASFTPCTSPLSHANLSVGAHSFAVRAIDVAGNVDAIGTASTWTVADGTPPSVTPAVTGTLGTNGWYRGPVSVIWSVVDLESSIISQTGCGQQSMSSDTAGVTFTCSATSAGGSASASVTIKIDATAPTLGASVSPTTVLQYLSPTVTPVGASDGLSGLAGTSCGVPDTAVAGAKTATCTATDNAGNVGTASAGYTVITASAAITNLINKVKSLRLDKASEKSLVNELTLAQGDLAVGRKASALTNMQDFINLVNGMRGRKISTTSADALVVDAQTIIRSIQASP